MRYTIFSVDDTREHYKQKIVEALPNWRYVHVDSIDGRFRLELKHGMEAHPYKINDHTEGGLKVGHLGIWYSVLNALDHAPIVTFEDDALLASNFQERFAERTRYMPGSFDFFSLFLPRDSDHLYDPATHGQSLIVKAYQYYGGVSMYYSAKGAHKIKKLLERDGIQLQYDNQLYKYARSGELEGYTSNPALEDLVYITGNEPSIVQVTDYI